MIPRPLNQLLPAYESLPEWQQCTLQVLAVLDRRVSRTAWMECVNHADIRDSNGQPLVFAAWKPVVEDFQRRGLVDIEKSKVFFAPGLDDALMRRIGPRSLARWAAAISFGGDRYINERRHKERHSYFSDKEDLWRDFRLSIHFNEPEVFEKLLGKVDDSRSGAKVDAMFRRVFNRPFDADWINSRARPIRDAAIRRIVESAHRNLEPVREVIDSLKIAEKGRPGWTWEKRLIVRDCLLRGETDKLNRWLPREGPSDAVWLHGCRACQQGRYARACELFDLGIRKWRKETRKRVVLLPTLEGAAHVAALIGSGDAKRLALAAKYLDLAIRKLGDPILYRVLRGAVDVVSGKRSKGPRAISGAGQIPDEPLLDQLFECAAMTWVDKSAGAQAAARVMDRHGRGLDEFYPWAGAEFAHMAGGGDSERSRVVHEWTGTVPFVGAVPELQPWERALGALERLATGAGTGALAAGPGTRLTWRMSGGGLKPFVQKRGKGGRWTAGRAVSLKRLYERVNVKFLTEQDELVCQAITATRIGYYGETHYDFDYDQAMRALVGHPLVFSGTPPKTHVEVVRAEPELRVSRRGQELRVALVPEPPSEGAVHTTFESSSRLVVTVFGDKHREIQSILGTNGIDVPVAAHDHVVRAVSGLGEIVAVHSDIDSSDATAEEVAADATMHFHLRPHESGLRVEALVRPLAEHGPAFGPGKGGKVVFSAASGRKIRARRNLSSERRRLRAAVAGCPSLERATKDSLGWTLPDPESSLSLIEELKALGDRVTVAWPQGETFRISQRANSRRLSLRIRASRDWFEIDGQLDVDGSLVIELRELLEGLDGSHGRFVPIGDRGFLALTERFRQLIDELAGCVERQGQQLRLHPTRMHALEAMVEDVGAVEADGEWKERLRRFRDAQTLDPVVPSTLRAELRDYQVRGFRWAARLAAWGAGACLADDMGLGKTLQSLTVILSRAPGGPALVVAPASVCPNWIDEARRFAPTLKPVDFGPGDRAAILGSAGPYDLVVCTYGQLHSAAEGLAGVDWETIVLDEAQAIKNPETMRSRAAMKLRGGFRMITTGTPIENHLGELWSLFNFTNPGLLGSHEAFDRDFANPICQDDDGRAAQRLKRLVQPYLLRRAKAAVLDELPARTQIMLRVEMSERERAFYEVLRQRAMETLEKEESDRRGNHVRVLAEIMRLRRSCCHPTLVAPGADIPGSKLDAFADLTNELLDNGHKALVFSQFVDHLRIVRSHLDRTGTPYRYLDGSTAPGDRKREVDAFQAGEGDIFLMSLRAGGQGLNLTAADYVIHLDPWWNPAVEDQASDRAHRIGQTRPVTIYRLVMANTIEEKIVELHARKRDLAASLLEGSDISGSISADELLALIRSS